MRPMSTAFRLLTLVSMLTLAGPAAAQLACVDEPNLVDFFLPLPWRPDAPNFNLATACAGEPYSQRIIINVPDEISSNGVEIPVSTMSLPTSGGISGLPSGMTYTCDPPNCNFGTGYSRCIELSGTPSNSNPTPATYDLKFSFEVATFAVIQAEYPTDFDPDAHVYLKLEEAGNCPEPDATVAGVAVLGILAALARRRPDRIGARSRTHGSGSGNPI